MEDAVARKVAALGHAPWTSEFPSSLIYALLCLFYSGTKPTMSVHINFGDYGTISILGTCICCEVRFK